MASGRRGGDVVLHPVSDLATATAGGRRRFRVAPHTDGSSCAGFEAAGQHVGITNLFNRLNGTTRQAPAAETMTGRTPKGE
jgi:hypothetical protein